MTEGIAVGELWKQFAAEARASYGLYSREVDWEAIARAKRWKKPFLVGGALFWAMLMKLSPARRVLLLLIVVLLLWPTAEVKAGRMLIGGEFFSIATLLLFVLLALELADRVTMKRDLEIAREIQRALLPAVPPQVPGVEIAFATRPANTVAGDYYDAFLRPVPKAPASLLLVVADVAGKSVPAALLMATFQASLRTLAALPGSLEDLVGELNRYACAHSLGGLRFTTAFLAELEPATGALSYVNAGHNAPVLWRASGAAERLEAGGLPLGIDADARFNSGRLTLARGDLLMIFTDGLVEAANDQREEYGERRLLERLQAVGNANAGATLNSVMAAVDAFVGTTRQHDDITCLILKAV